MDRDSVEPDVDVIPGGRAQEWVEQHDRHAAPSTYLYPFVWDVTAPAIGPFCTDVDGNVLMDFTSHVGSAPLGYNNPKLLEPLQKFDLVDPLKIAGQDLYVAPDTAPANPGPTGLMDRLTAVCEHYDMDTVFLSNSGAEAVENAIKICYDHTNGREAITFEGAFHGRTLGALSLNRSKAVHRRRFPSVSNVHSLPFCRRGTCSGDRCSCGFFTGSASTLRDMLDSDRGYIDPADLAYVIVEPVQGVGGYHVPTDRFMEELATIRDEYGILVIADEVQSGLGRTGQMWAADQSPLEPDVIACAKALRVGATVARSAVFPDQTGRISSTWGGGDILATIQGSLTLDAITDHDLPDNAAKRGRQARDLLADADLPTVAAVRGRGLMLGIAFEDQPTRDAVLRACLDRGLLTLSGGNRTIRLLPPLDVTEREIDLGVGLFIDTVRSTA